MAEIIVTALALIIGIAIGRWSTTLSKVKWADLNGNIYYFDVDFDPNQVRTGWYRSID